MRCGQSGGGGVDGCGKRFLGCLYDTFLAEIHIRARGEDNIKGSITSPRTSLYPLFPSL